MSGPGKVPSAWLAPPGTQPTQVVRKPRKKRAPLPKNLVFGLIGFGAAVVVMAVWILIQFATAERERPRPALQPLVAAEDEPELEIDIELPPVDDSLLDELPTTRRAKALTSRGEDELDKRRWKRALGLFERALALEPDLPRAHRGRGIALARLRRFDDARLAYTRYIELAPAAPDAPDVRRLLGM